MFETPPSQNARGDEDKSEILVSIRQHAAATMFDCKTANAESFGKFALGRFIVVETQEIDGHAFFEKRLCCPARSRIGGIWRERHHSRALPLKAEWGSD